MTQHRAGWRFLSFIAAFVFVYAIIVWNAGRLFSDVLKLALPIVSTFKIRLITAICLSPITSGLIGTWAASVRLLSYGGLGQDRITTSKFFGLGWLAMLAGNYISVVGLLWWALPQEIGERWMNVIGVE